MKVAFISFFVHLDVGNCLVYVKPDTCVLGLWLYIYSGPDGE